MSGPEQPWWAKPGGAPPPGTPPPGAPRPFAPPPRAARPPAPRPAPVRPVARPNPYGPLPQHRGPTRTPPPPPGRTRRSAPGRWPVIAAGAVVVGVIAAVGLVMWMRDGSGGTRLDVHQAETGVAQILSDPVYGYGANDVAAVACNNGRNPRVEVGATFTCAVDINGTVRQVTVEFTDIDGTYAVDGPR